MLHRLGIRGKLLAVVAVPVLALLGALGALVTGSISDYRVADNAQLLTAALDSARDTERDLQAERWASINFVDAIRVGSEQTATAAAAVDEQAGLLRERMDAIAEREITEEYTFEDREADVESGARVVSKVEDVLAGEALAEARTVALTPPSEAGEWVGFPEDADITAMASAYADAAATLESIASGAPDATDARASVAAIALAIENEAAARENLLREPQEYMETLDRTFEDVETGLDAIAAAAAAVPESPDNDVALSAVSAGGELRESLPQARAAIKAGAIDGGTLLTQYTAMLDQFTVATRQIAIAMPDRARIAEMTTYADIDELVETLEYEKAFTERIIRRGSFQGNEANSIRGVQERTRLALQDAKNAASGLSTVEMSVPDLGASIDLSTAAGTSFEAIRNRLFDGSSAAVEVVKDDDWASKADLEIAQYTPLTDELWASIEDAVAANARNAVTETIIVIVGAAAATIAALLITFAIARRISVPLRRLTTTASAVREELPRLVERAAMPGEEVDVAEVQISVDSQDEVGRLAEAFNGVNAATIEIAREQAALRASISEMFVNVARRDQVLLNRQLASIDEMERTEDDPARLTKLFALDHLATRMRRNSESLLVLAGIDTGRRLRRAMPLSDVVRTASSEIELYERIDLDLVVDPSMHGHQALTAAHLFAELLENATVFSDPGSRVVVRTGRSVEGFTVEVIDTGIGMTAAELAEANSRVQSSAASEILGAQRLGLFVVGRIARRLGAHVALTAEEGTGTVATVLLPNVLFEAVGDDAPVVETYTPSQVPTLEPPAAAVAPIAPAAPAPEAELPHRAEPAPGLPQRGEPAPAAQPVVEDDDAPIPVPSLDELIAADAAAAPVGEAVSGADLTEGTSTAGLPARRRRGGDDASSEDRNVIGLPVRATADQLDALAAETAAFTPSVAPSEVTPQTPEERASMFRGFRSRRDAAPAADGAEVHLPEQAALPSRRREAAPEAAAEIPEIPVIALEPDEDEVAPAASAPVLEVPVLEESAFEAPAPALEPDPEPVAEAAPAAPQIPTAASLGGAFAAFDAIRRASAKPADQPVAEVPAEPVVEPAPVDAAPTVDAEPTAEVEAVEAAPEEAPVHVEPTPSTPTFSVPKLALPLQSRAAAVEPTPEAPSPFARSPYGAAFAARPTEPVAPAEPVAEPEPLASAPVEDVAPTAEAAPEPASAPQPFAPIFDLSATPLGQAPVPQPTVAPAPEPEPEPVAEVQPEPAVEPAPVAEPEPAQPLVARTPFLPALEPDPEPEAVAPVIPALEPEPVVDEAPAPVEDVAPVVPEPVADAPAAPWQSVEAPSAPVTPPWMAGAEFAVRAAELDAEPAPRAAAPTMDDIIAQASGEEAARAGFFGRLFGRGRGDEPLPAPRAEAPASPQAPEAPASFMPTSFEPDLSAASQPTFQAPERAAEPTPAYAPEPVAEAPVEAHDAYTPEELAKPSGWEAAGESALAADMGAGPAVYQPVIDTDHASERGWADDEADMTRAVFSELSSLSESRPKVEKTKAGLQRRQRAKAPEPVTPIAEEITLTPKDRDADAVRNRFSSFYSGTQRARSDVAELELRSTPEPAHE